MVRGLAVLHALQEPCAQATRCAVARQVARPARPPEPVIHDAPGQAGLEMLAHRRARPHPGRVPGERAVHKGDVPGFAHVRPPSNWKSTIRRGISGENSTNEANGGQRRAPLFIRGRRPRRGRAPRGVKHLNQMGRVTHRGECFEKSRGDAGFAQSPEPLPNAVPVAELGGKRPPCDVVDHEIV